MNDGGYFDYDPEYLRHQREVSNLWAGIVIAFFAGVWLTCIVGWLAAR